MRAPSSTIGLVYALVVGAAVALGLTWWTTGDAFQFGALRIGPWQAWPLSDPVNADRYGRARIARSGDLPLGPGEGLAFTAVEDSDGRALDGGCHYTITPILPPARWWTLSLYDARGKPVSNPSERFGFASSAVIRGEKGGATIETGPSIQPGNWLPSAAGPVALVLRLYDSPVSTGLATELGARRAIDMPAIERGACQDGSRP
ncbi:membrane protein [Labrys miyagiensis]